MGALNDLVLPPSTTPGCKDDDDDVLIGCWPWCCGKLRLCNSSVGRPAAKLDLKDLSDKPFEVPPHLSATRFKNIRYFCNIHMRTYVASP